MDLSGRLIWALWGAVAGMAALILILFVSTGSAPALGERIDLDRTGPTVSSTSSPHGASTPTESPAAPTTEVVKPQPGTPVRVPAGPVGDHDGDDDDRDDDDWDDDDDDDE